MTYDDESVIDAPKPTIDWYVVRRIDRDDRVGVPAVAHRRGSGGERLREIVRRDVGRGRSGGRRRCGVNRRTVAGRRVARSRCVFGRSVDVSGSQRFRSAVGAGSSRVRRRRPAARDEDHEYPHSHVTDPLHAARQTNERLSTRRRELHHAVVDWRVPQRHHVERVVLVEPPRREGPLPRKLVDRLAARSPTRSRGAAPPSPSGRVRRGQHCV